MNPSAIERHLQVPGTAERQALLDDDQAVFWVDWRSDDAEIVAACEAVLGSGRLTCEAGDTDDLTITFGERRLPVPLTQSVHDRHHTLMALNRVLSPDYELRLVAASDGADTLAFTVLPRREWVRLTDRFGQEQVDTAFRPLRDDQDVFTNPRPGRRPRNASDGRVGKPWWRFW